MNDNPFSEPEDNDRTVLRVSGARSAAEPARTAPAEVVSPQASAAPFGTPKLGGEADALPKVGKSPIAAAAAPLLDLLARIGAGPQAAHVGDPRELRERAVRALQTFEAECRAAMVPDDHLRAAHYALCAALDDTALATPWGQSSNWAAHSLSSTFHQDVRSGERFFDLLSGMQKEPGRYLPALEICYLCLSLGLRGRYRLAGHGSEELERVREGLYQVLAQMNGPWERELSPHWRGVNAPHRGASRAVPPWVIGAVALALLAFGYVWASSWINAKGDALQARVTQLPPSQTPQIARDAPPVPPAGPTSSGAVDGFRKFLEPEIAQGLVVVKGDAQRVMVRIMAKGMFESGSTEVQPRFVVLLKRVGEALRTEPGQVVVLGHSDNQPIRTVRFPSNFQLSAARAESAKSILASATAQPDRFTSIGRADTEPLVANDSPEGREANRRIEVVLTRGEAR